jgi:hypothetical protein
VAPASTRASRQRAWPLGRAGATWIALVAAAACGWALYTWANYREEHQVERFLDAVTSGQYQRAHAMWGSDEYGFERFLADWGTRGRHTVGGSEIEVIDSTTNGAGVTIYIKTAASTPVALEVDKETMLLSYAPSNKYAADAATR